MPAGLRVELGFAQDPAHGRQFKFFVRLCLIVKFELQGVSDNNTDIFVLEHQWDPMKVPVSHIGRPGVDS